MNIYHTGAFLKIVLALLIAYPLYYYVNVFQQPALALSFGFLAVFLFTWSLMYFFFLSLYKIFSFQSGVYQVQKSYSMSLLTGIYVMLNVAMMIMGNWTMLLAGVFLVFFVIFLIVIAYTENL